jgi:hypothetical protein
MKRSIVTLLLLAFVIMLTTSYAVIPDLKSKPTSCIINYYWFDVTRTWLGRQNTVCDEIFLTAFDESTSSPKTLQEMGWSPANVSLNGYGVPVPLSSTPDKALYSHP